MSGCGGSGVCQCGGQAQQPVPAINGIGLHSPGERPDLDLLPERAWGELLHSVRTGEPAFDRVFGMSNFEYWERDLEAGAILRRCREAMAPGAEKVDVDRMNERRLDGPPGGHECLRRDHPAEDAPLAGSEQAAKSVTVDRLEVEPVEESGELRGGRTIHDAAGRRGYAFLRAFHASPTRRRRKTRMSRPVRRR